MPRMGKYKFDVYYSHRVRFTYLSNYAIIDLESIRKMLWPVSDRALARADKSRLETGPSELGVPHRLSTHASERLAT